MEGSQDNLAFIGGFVKRFLLPFHPIRYFHSLLVKDVALAIGDFYPKIPRQSLFIAALCHDMAKYLPLEQVKTIALEYKEPFPEDLEDYPTCIHGFTASILLKHQLKITDESILEAVQFHTTGKPNMSQLGLVLYTADFLGSNFASPHHEEFPALYEEACSNIAKASLIVCEKTISYLQQSEKPIHPLSFNFRSWLQSPTSEEAAR